MISIDTIKVGFPLEVWQSNTFFKVFPKSYCGVTWNRLTQNDMACRFRYHLTDIETGSYSSHVLFSENGNMVVFEFSLPKFVYGENLTHCWNYDYVLEEFRQYLAGKLQFDIPLLSSWRLYRIDVSYNFNLGSPGNVQQALDLLKKMRYRGSPGRYWKKDKSAYWSMQSRTIKFYDKQSEILKNKKHFFVEDFESLYNSASGVLRYEEEWHLKYLSKILNSSSNNEITVGSFGKWEGDNYNYISHIQLILGEIDTKEQKIEELSLTLKEFYGRKFSSYLRFLNLYLTSSREKMLSCYSKPQFYRYKKAFLDMGINLDMVSESFKSLSCSQVIDTSVLKLINPNNLFVW